MSGVSDEQFTGLTHESESEHSSESSEETCNSDFIPYDENLEPFATEDEVAEYAEQVAEEEEEERMLLSRFAGEVDVSIWCKCSNCSLEHVVKAEECRCCMEVNRCRERMEEVEKEEECITVHPGFRSGCLDRWVLKIAGIGLKTKAKKPYSTTLAKGYRAEPEFLRSVAYRQFVRLVWEYVGASNRLPLPSCVYNAIRAAFPNEAAQYHGFVEEEEEEEETPD